MRYALTFAILLFANGSAFAQNDRPQLVWEGEVSGGATLFIQGDRVDIQGRETGAVTRPSIRFREPLPAVPQRVRVEVRQGRGRVEVVEHPNRQNDYASVVDIRNDGRPEMYRLAFFWDSDQGRYSSGDRRRGDDSGYRGRTNERYPNRGAATRGGAGQMSWSGQVDQEAMVVVRGRRAETTTLRGQNVYGDRAEFTSALPRGNVTVNLADTRGRGQVELIEHPTPENNFAAKVRITDRDSGADTYSFTLAWDDGSGYGTTNDPYYRSGPANDPYYRGGTSTQSGGILTPGGGVYDDRNAPASSGTYGSYGGSGVRWSGRVDGTLRVHVRGNQVWSQRVSGGPVYDERASVGTPLPRVDFRDVDVNKIAGRGDVDMVQRPDRDNNYTLIFEIEDKDSGADFYEIEVVWR